jgi:hypothetical protein
MDSAMEAVLGAASAAVLAVYRPDGEIVMSPVWFRVEGDWVEIVVAEGDAKLDHLRNDARCVFIAFEIVPPFAGVRIQTDAILTSDGVRETRLAIAIRYLGSDAGGRYVEQRSKPGVVVRLPLSRARSWDLRAILPE